MYSTCLHCTRDLGTNDVVEALPIGRRLAFDAAQGRLWVVCRSCGKWNLVPFDNRLEAIDACERLFRDTRKRFSTDNIGLARMPDGTDLVRIGKPQRPEFASWRYGAQYKRRRRVNMAFGAVGLLASQAVVELALLTPGQSSLVLATLTSMGTVLAATSASTYLQGLRVRVLTTLPGRSGAIKLGPHIAGSAHIRMDGGDLSVIWSPKITIGIPKQFETTSGPGGRLLARQALGLLNREVGSTRELNGAVARVERGGVDQWLSRLSSSTVEYPKARHWDRSRLGISQASSWVAPPRTSIRYPGADQRSFLLASLPRADRLAIEMWLSEEDEARALSGELALLERQWKEAEELAAIADGLTLAPADDSRK